MDFEGKLANLMTVNFFRYTVTSSTAKIQAENTALYYRITIIIGKPYTW